ncbi:MAG: putative transposase [Gammaproteobacteria bacterium]|jgi:putative transposase
MGDVTNRWYVIYPGPAVIQLYLPGDALNELELVAVSSIAETWRRRLDDLSSFMRCLNEHIARRANAEDGSTGRFWEGRFTSQALSDEPASITAIAHVDLNPIRAKMANGLTDSDKSSVRQRLQAVTNQTAGVTVPLRQFAGTTNNQNTGIPFNLQNYLGLVDWTGRCVRHGQRGSIVEDLPQILTQLGTVVDEWLATVTEAQARYELVTGSPEKMKTHAESRGGRSYRGYRTRWNSIVGQQLDCGLACTRF